MEFVMNNWEKIAVAVILLAGVIYCIFRFEKMTVAERERTILGWLLGAVTIAEQQFGGGTGKLKLSSVWGEFCRDLPWLAKVISFEKFSELVDKALVEMRKLIETNTAVAGIVEKQDNV